MASPTCTPLQTKIFSISYSFYHPHTQYNGRLCFQRCQSVCPYRRVSTQVPDSFSVLWSQVLSRRVPQSWPGVPLQARTEQQSEHLLRDWLWSASCVHTGLSSFVKNSYVRTLQRIGAPPVKDPGSASTLRDKLSVWRPPFDLQLFLWETEPHYKTVPVAIECEQKN